MTYEVKPLTGLRWFAALGVYIYHFGSPGWFPTSLKNLEVNGFFGVQFFFVLSGYVLTTRYFENQIRLKTYAFARFARIGPMYFCGLFLGFLYYLRGIEPLNYKLAFVHLLGLQAWSSSMDNAVSFNGPAWTISVELFFYALFPFVLKLSRRFASSIVKSLALMCVGTAYGAALISLHHIRFGPIVGSVRELPNEYLWFGLIPIHYLGLFIAGVGAAHLAQEIIRSPRGESLKRIFRPSLAIVVVLIPLLTMNFNSTAMPYFSILVRFSIAAIPTAYLLTSLHLHPSAVISKILGIGPLNLLGKVSYAFYIIHVPFIWIIRRLIPGLNYEAQLVLLCCAATACYFIVEQPLRKYILQVADKTK